MRISRFNKAQAAMEFLMTYGWAILVVLAAIAALAYFGVLSPQKFLPEKCFLQAGFACVSHKVEPTQVTLVILNSLGKTITVDSITVGSCSGIPAPQTLLNEDQKTFVIGGGACSNGVSKENFKGDIAISYTEKDYNLTKTAYGNLNSKVE
ncbi:hypothetical protein HYX04_05260 [Candidatus Woesearchaeota archaeon]|nr:hypothetical protein [Candidatus Woesearchaeota archaeon]